MPHLTVWEVLRVLAFLGLVVVVYAGAVWVLARAIGRRLAPRAFSTDRLPWRARWIFPGLAAVGIVCMIYGRFVEPYWPEVTRVRLETRKVPTGSRPIRIAQISDLHCDPDPRLEERLPGLIAAERPDLILFTGDSINSREALPVLRRLLSRLAAIAPTYAVKGNWDRWLQDLDLFGGTGVVELNGEPVTIGVGETAIWIAGVGVGSESLLGRALENVPQDTFSIFLYHMPDLIEEVSAKRIDLYCAGHTHGGQVALPFYGALVTLSKFGKKYEAGLYQVMETRLYVNRGIGMEGGGAPRVRFCARPEITVFEIVPTGSSR